MVNAYFESDPTTKERKLLVESIDRLSYHIPKCVFSSLLKRAQDGTPIRQKIPHELWTSVILLVDISGFTRLSTRLGAERFSKVINDYFQLMINEIDTFGGQVLKFAGDAVFVEWRIYQDNDIHQHNPDNTIKDGGARNAIFLALSCAYNITLNCCDYKVASSEFENEIDDEVITLNIHCGLGVGNIVHMHAGNTFTTHDAIITTSSNDSVSVKYHINNDESNANMDTSNRRRDYLVFGDVIEQVAVATDAAGVGDVCISPEVVNEIRTQNEFEFTDTFVRTESPVVISKGKNVYNLPFFNAKDVNIRQDIPLNHYEYIQNRIHPLKSMDMSALMSLRQELSLYVHQVVKRVEEDIFEIPHLNIATTAIANLDDGTQVLNSHVEKKCDNYTTQSNVRQRFQENSILEYAELRTVYTMFVMPLISTKAIFKKRSTTLSIYEKQKILKLISLLNSIYEITIRELQKYGGHLLQFIIDDKGVVLIGTFGLRGSIFPHMISERGLPATMCIHQALEEELDIESRIGATAISNHVYCGLVGSPTRHTYGVMGPSINLAARLMASPKNPGILVNDEVRIQCDNRFLFNTAMDPVKAKGYQNPVQIFEPLSILDKKWRRPRYFIGRHSEIMTILNLARSVTAMRARRRNSSSMGKYKTKILSVRGESGIGKSAMVYQALKKIQQIDQGKKSKKISTMKVVCEEGDEFVPFSTCRALFSRLLGGHEDFDHLSDNLPSQSSLIDSHSMRRLSEISISSDQMERLVREDYSNASDITGFSAFSKNSINLTFENIHAICEKRNKSEEFARFLSSNIFGVSHAGKHNTGDDKNKKAPKESDVVDFFVDLFTRNTLGKNLTVLAIDDVQWMDSSSWQVLEGLFDKGENLFIIIVSRNDDWHKKTEFHNKMQMELQNPLPRYKNINLGSVTMEDTKQLISRFTKMMPGEVDDSFCSNIYEQSAGMPLFAIEILNSLEKKIGNKINSPKIEEVARKDIDITERSDIYGNSKLDSFSSLSVLLLCRFDCFNANSKAILQLCGVLGFEFKVSEVCRVYDSYMNKNDRRETSIVEIVTETLIMAVREGILVESYLGHNDESDEILEMQEDEEAEEDRSSGVFSSTFSSTFKNEQLRQFSFSHSMWRATLLDNMIKKNKQRLHNRIADAIELDATCSNDVTLMVRCFTHRRDSGNASRTADVAFFLSNHFDKIGLFSQTLNLMKETLTMWSLNLLLRDDDVRGMNTEQLENSGGFLQLQIVNLLPSDLMKISQLFVISGRCLGGIYQGLAKFAAFYHAYYITLETSKISSIPDGHNPFAVFSGLLLCLKAGPVTLSKEESVAFEKHLSGNFVLVAERSGEMAHVCRALAAQSQTFAKFGNFDRALSIQKRLEDMYSPSKFSVIISNSYGSDRAAQNFGQATIWYDLLKAEEKVNTQIDFVLHQLLPMMDLENVHNTFMLMFPVMNAMKKRGRGFESYNIFKMCIVDKFEARREEGKSTFFLPLYKPILVLFHLLAMETKDTETICSPPAEYLEWVLQGNQGQFSRHMESGVITLGQDGKTIVAEICLILAMRCKQITEEKRRKVIAKGIRLANDSLTCPYVSGDLCKFARNESQIILSALQSLET